METTREEFCIGAWVVRPTLNRLVRGEEEIQVEPRIMRVLICLAAQPGEVISRDELLQEAWPGVVVTDDPLNRAISELRKYFADDPKNPSYIETIRKVGYRLIAPVHHTNGLTASPSSTPARLETNGQGVSIPLSHKNKPSLPIWMIIGLGLLIATPVFIIGKSFIDRSPDTITARPVPFTSMPGLEFDPTFSPDGSRISFTWNGGALNNFDIYVRLLDAASMVRLTTDPAREEHPAWSPDGQFIAYVQTSPEGCMIRQVPALGGISRRLADCFQARDLVWSPDGAALIYSDRVAPGAPYLLYSLPLDTAQRSPLTNPPPSYYGDSSPTFSPDGQSIAFVRSSISGLDHILTIPASGGPTDQVSAENQEIEGLIWPQDNLMVYASDWDGPISLYVQPPRNAASTWVVTGGDGVHHPTLNAAGDLIYEEWRWDKNIWRISTDSSSEAPAPFVASTRWDRSPSISPDGTQVVFISNRTGSYEIWLWNQTTGQLEAITDFQGPNLNMPRWSPDGSSIVFDLRSNGNAEVYTLDIDSREFNQITHHEDNDVTPIWSADMQSIFYSSNRTGVWEIWKTDLQTGEAVQITRAGGYSAHPSTDGRWLYFTKDRIPGIWRLPQEGGEEELVLAALRAADWGNWQLQEDGIYFVDRRRPAHTSLESAVPGASISFFDFATGEVWSMYSPDKPVANPGLAASKDGSFVLYVQIDQSQSDLMRTSIR